MAPKAAELLSAGKHMFKVWVTVKCKLLTFNQSIVVLSLIVTNCTRWWLKMRKGLHSNSWSLDNQSLCSEGFTVTKDFFLYLNCCHAYHPQAHSLIDLKIKICNMRVSPQFMKLIWKEYFEQSMRSSAVI